jgi:hypothetical protein
VGAFCNPLANARNIEREGENLPPASFYEVSGR